MKLTKTKSSSFIRSWCDKIVKARKETLERILLAVNKNISKISNQQSLTAKGKLSGSLVCSCLTLQAASITHDFFGFQLSRYVSKSQFQCGTLKNNKGLADKFGLFAKKKEL